MIRRPLRAAVIWGVTATLLLPIVLAVVVGLGALLGAVGDVPGARACGRVAVATAAVWLVAVIATTAVSALAVLDREDEPPTRGRRDREGRAARGRRQRAIGPEPGQRLG